MKTIGVEGQLQLKKAKVLLIGVGGLGCPALQYMAAAGVGHLHLIDGDAVSESNLQRQLLFNHTDIGKFKAETAALKLKLINPLIEITYQNQFLTPDLALNLFPDFDLIVDCSDNFGTRYLINDVCLLYNLAFVSASLYQTEAQLGTFNVLLQDNTRSASYSDFFPESNKSAKTLDCNTAGVIATLPGIMGIMQANEVLKYFTNTNSCLFNRLLLFSATTLHTTFFNYDGISSSKNTSRESILKKSYDIPCLTGYDFIIDSSEIERMSQVDYKIIDVRETNEVPRFNNNKIINIPLSVLHERINELNKYNTIIFVCKSGIRSKKAAELAKEKLIEKRVYSYINGIEDLIKLV